MKRVTHFWWFSFFFSNVFFIINLSVFLREMKKISNLTSGVV